MKQKKIKIELTDEQFNMLAKEAHEKDITFNQHINEVLREFIDKIEKGEITLNKEDTNGKRTTKRISKRSAR